MSDGAGVFWWVILPYVAITVFVVGHVWRYRTDQFGWTSRSTQLFERRLLGIGAPLFHYGALAAIGGHVIGILIPESFTESLGISESAYKDFSTGAGTLAALATLIGFGLLLYRRTTVKRVRRTTTRVDMLTYGLLTALIVLGSFQTIGINLIGSGYNYREDVAPWFRGVLRLNPDPDLMRGVDASYQVHAVLAWGLYMLWPFSRLVHAWSVPIQYLGRPAILYRSRYGGALPVFAGGAAAGGAVGAGGPGPVRRVLDALPPASGGAVMGTGIVSVALALDRRTELSEALMWIALGMWVALALLLAARFLFHRARFLAEAAIPASLTGVAGTCVLGARLTVYGWEWAGIALLAIGGLFLLALFGPVLQHWRRPTVGASFLLTVSIQSVAVLSATLAVAEDRRGLVVLAAVLLVVGIAFYLWVLRDFDLRQLLVGKGDHWIAGGAVAISALAAGRVVQAIDSTGALRDLRAVLDAVAVVLIVAELIWLPLLIAGEIARPRLHFSALRWATVFPVGMYAASSFTVGAVGGHAWMTDFADVWIWVAVAVWAVVAVGTVARGAALLSGRAEQAAPTSAPPRSAPPPAARA
ncbi:respiratory nitrate reductase subunit gamma [Conexibacter woesei]|uniref:Nitrate reductase-like protein NarX n=1 Tax=Conexibacter woesei (strain DSM 14684 / CCUG 47730 / CIP 108061 / JCM 11494 / NBRC 100937 / ID131577) TaxID=469383 RepID=D3EZU0_CONWI|nr:respiratory nitrate reductase subunit gamma [Conexibacter woesei]ADB49916.1 respiratory nitrate reductase, gamma subunit [Conexibacter woesei DSM 14684]